MFKLKLIFSVLILTISTIVILFFLKFDLSLKEISFTPKIIRITGFSPNAYLYSDPEMKSPLHLEDLDFKNEQGIMTPQQVSIELLCKDLFVEMLPLSFIKFSPELKSLALEKGKFYWNRIKKGRTYLSVSGGEYELQLSGKGRLNISEKGDLTIWIYKGISKIKNSSGEFELNPGQLYYSSEKNPFKSEKILPSPEFISPEDKKIYLKKLKDAVVKLECKAVISASGYNFKLYTSKLRENILIEKKTVSNRISINLADFEGNRVFYWEVFPLNENESEGEPSSIGRIRLFGSALEEKINLQPPEISIISLTVNGNLVLIKGKTDSGSTLFIDEVPVPLEQDGSFIYTKIFKSMGLKTISFKVISTAEVESVITRQVTIFDE